MECNENGGKTPYYWQEMEIESPSRTHINYVALINARDVTLGKWDDDGECADAYSFTMR